MAVDVTLAALHHLFAFGLVGMLMAQWALLRGEASAAVLQRLARYDLFYGVAALGLICVGIGRVFYGLKGPGFYVASPFFWIKIASFTVVGAMSIIPTRRYARWRRDADRLPHPALWIATRKLVVIEAHVLSIVMICAALMARGIGIAS